MIPLFTVVYLTLAAGWLHGDLCGLAGLAVLYGNAPAFQACLVGPPHPPVRDDVAFCQRIMPADYDGAVAQAFDDACQLTLKALQKQGNVPPEMVVSPEEYDRWLATVERINRLHEEDYCRHRPPGPSEICKPREFLEHSPQSENIEDRRRQGRWGFGLCTSVHTQDFCDYIEQVIEENRRLEI